MNFMDILRNISGADNYFDRVPANRLAAAGQPAHPATSTPQGAYGNGYGDSVPSPGFGASMHTLGQALSPVQPAQAATLPAAATPGPQPATPSANDLTAALVRSAGAPAANPPTDPWAGLRTAVPNSGVTGEPGSLTLIPNGQNPFGSMAPAAPVSPMTTGSTAPAKSPSLFDRFENFTASPRGQALADMFAGWAMGKSPQQSLGYGAFLMNKGTKSRRKNNDTVDWLVGRGMDRSEAETVARNPTALSAVLKQMLTPQKAPQIVEQYDEHGNPRKMIWDQTTKSYKPFGGSKTPSGGITIGPDGTVTIGGKVPTGYESDPNNPGAIKPIPGGPGARVPSELAARIGMADSFLKDYSTIRERVAAGDVTGPIDRAEAGNLSSSPQAGVYRQIQSGVDALRRMLTGAGMPHSEANEYVTRYLPTYTDTAASATAKLDQLAKELTRMRAMALRGRGGTEMPPATGGQTPQAATPNTFRYDPATGELEPEQ